MKNENKNKFWIEVDKDGNTKAIGGISTAREIKVRGLIPTNKEF